MAKKTKYWHCKGTIDAETAMPIAAKNKEQAKKDFEDLVRHKPIYAKGKPRRIVCYSIGEFKIK